MGDFTTYHVDQFKPRNRMEQQVVSYCKTHFEGPWQGTIDEAREVLLKMITSWGQSNPSTGRKRITGTVLIGEVKVCGTYVGGGIACRSFRVTAKGRKIHTAIVTESYPSNEGVTMAEILDILQVAHVAETMQTCYEQRMAIGSFDAETDVYVNILRKAMDRHGKPVMDTTLDMLKLAQADDEAAIATHGFCAAAYWLMVVEPKETHIP